MGKERTRRRGKIVLVLVLRSRPRKTRVRRLGDGGLRGVEKENGEHYRIEDENEKKRK